jgi:ascorbate-specific PTS system EIIC-type component UlaA
MSDLIEIKPSPESSASPKNGTVTIPSYSFSNNADAGIYRGRNGEWRAAYHGTDITMLIALILSGFSLLLSTLALAFSIRVK